MPTIDRMLRRVALRHVLACVNRYDHRTAVSMTHDVMAAADSRHRESGAVAAPSHVINERT